LTSDEAIAGGHALRWHVFSKPGAVIPLNKDSAHYKFFVDNPFLLCPLAPEVYTDDGSGNVVQAFFGGVVLWEPDKGCRVVH